MIPMNQRLHIGHFTNTYHPLVSGVTRSVSNFRRGLTELGHNVFVFAQQDDDYVDEEPFIFRYPAFNLPLMSNFPLNIPFSPFIDKVLPYLKLDIIHSHHPFLLGQTAIHKSEELNLPLVFTYHTRYQEYSHYIPLSQEFVKETIGRWVGEYMEQCHHIIVPSQSIKELLFEEYGLCDQITVVQTGIDLTPYQNGDSSAVRRQQGWNEDIVLISIGRMAEEKNWKLLLEAAALVMRGREDIRLVLIGDGDDREALEHYAADLGIAEKTEFTGSLPFEDVPRYLSAADIFCFASVTETQGLVTMEAMAAGLPVAAVDASGTRDVIEHGTEGFLSKNESEALAQEINRLIQDEALRHCFGEAAWQKAQTFTMTHQAEKLIPVYEQAREDKLAERFVKIDKEKAVFTMV